MTKFLPAALLSRFPPSSELTYKSQRSRTPTATWILPWTFLERRNMPPTCEGFSFIWLMKPDLAGLKIIGGDGLITGTQIRANGVIDLGNGNNLHGAANPFDVGIAFGTAGKGQDFIKGPVHFTLDAESPLTLDDISHVLFGARLTSVGDKLTFLAPAAPDAIDDPVNTATTTHEDTQINYPGARQRHRRRRRQAHDHRGRSRIRRAWHRDDLR